MLKSTIPAVRQAALAILAFAFIASSVWPLNAQGDQGYTTKAARAILIDAATGAVLFQQRADELAPPASMSKLMTLAVLFKAIKEGKVSTSDEYTMSVNAWRKGGAPSRTSAMMVPVNTTATVGDLIRGIAIQSGNDACIAVAEAMAGSEAAFAKLMTQEARRIGLTKSTFGNATGLPNENQLMTMRELALLADYLIKEYPDQYPVFGQKEFLYRKHKFYNRNPLLFLDIGADGLKTGHTNEAGYGLVGSAVRDGKRLIVVVSGLQTADARKQESAKLLEWGFNAFSKVRIFDDNEVVGRARVWGGSKMYVPLTSKGDVTISLPKYPANQRLSAEIVYRAPLKPPVRKGDQVATLKISSTSSASAEIPLYAQEDVEPAGLAWRGIDTLVIMALRRLTL
ncbi:MAG: D-alanyl-D-alanine carboxypeptidase [Hyphomicrobiaceae bacterium]|nr:D-alanyl-D-alanine carboxypeptidase [Hyphomicrobiaceae bacterium]